MIFAKNNTLWRDAVCAKSAGICEICGNEGCDPHHVIKRMYKKVALLVMNGVWLCRGCHVWAEQHPFKFKEWFFLKYGENLYYKIKELSQR